jgi:hypothetical protein
VPLLRMGSCRIFTPRFNADSFVSLMVESFGVCKHGTAQKIGWE